MAFPALRHALVAVVLLRGVAAHDPSKCYEWGYPKEGRWQHDEDCCAGEDQAACAAGYRYHNTDIVCAREHKCVAYEYTCTKCDGAGCDTNYDINSEDGVDYDCYTHFMICWILWPVAYFFLGISIHRVKEVIGQGDEAGAKELWAKRKKAALILFVLCMSLMHWIALAWMGPWTIFWIGPCFLLGIIVPIACCCHGDRIVKAGRTRPPPAPAPRVELPARCARPAAAAPAGRTLRGLRIESVAQTEVTLAWEQGSAEGFEVQWRRTGGAWHDRCLRVRRSKARVSELDAGGAYAFRVRAFGGDWSYEVSARLAAPAEGSSAGPLVPTSAAEEEAMVERALAESWRDAA